MLLEFYQYELLSNMSVFVYPEIVHCYAYQEMLAIYAIAS